MQCAPTGIGPPGDVQYYTLVKNLDFLSVSVFSYIFDFFSIDYGNCDILKTIRARRNLHFHVINVRKCI